MATIAEQLTSLANTKTAIKDAIVAKGVSVADTDPFSAYPAKIGEIQAGGGGAPATKYGVSLDNLLGDVDGTLIRPEAPFDFVATGITSIEWKSLAYKFWSSLGCSSALFPDLITITGERSCSNAFNSCYEIVTVSMPKLESIDGSYVAENMFLSSYFEHDIDFPSLKTISGTYACANMFQYAHGATGVNMPALTTISGIAACRYMFASSPNIVYVNVPSLTTIDGSNACQYMFQGNTGLTRVDFPSLTTITNANSLGTSSSNGMFAGCTGLLEIHFRADAQATIEGLSGYATKFGATNATIYFDL